jgi:hypothetical protein
MPEIDTPWDARRRQLLAASAIGREILNSQAAAQFAAAKVVAPTLEEQAAGSLPYNLQSGIVADPVSGLLTTKSGANPVDVTRLTDALRRAQLAVAVTVGTSGNSAVAALRDRAREILGRPLTYGEQDLLGVAAVDGRATDRRGKLEIAPDGSLALRDRGGIWHVPDKHGAAEYVPSGLEPVWPRSVPAAHGSTLPPGPGRIR